VFDILKMAPKRCFQLASLKDSLRTLYPCGIAQSHESIKAEARVNYYVGSHHLTKRIGDDGDSRLVRFNIRTGIIGRKIRKMNLQKVLPPAWFLLSMILMVGLHFWLPVKQLFFPPITYLGIGEIALGIMMFLFCVYLFRQNNTLLNFFKNRVI
jgi:hypothetical protein